MQILIENVHELWLCVHAGAWPALGFGSYVLLALLVATEGPVSTLLGAAAAAAGLLDIRFVFLAALIGNVTGDSLWFTLGYINNPDRIHRLGRWLGLKKHHIDRLEAEMHLHATKLIVLSKLAVGLIIPTLVAAGLARIPVRRWLPLVLLVETLWTIFLVNLGYHSAGLLTEFERGIQLLGGVALLLIGGVIVWYGRRIFQQSEASMAAELTNQASATLLAAPAVVPTMQLRDHPEAPPKKQPASATPVVDQPKPTPRRKASTLEAWAK